MIGPIQIWSRRRCDRIVGRRRKPAQNIDRIPVLFFFTFDHGYILYTTNRLSTRTKLYYSVLNINTHFDFIRLRYREGVQIPAVYAKYGSLSIGLF